MLQLGVARNCWDFYSRPIYSEVKCHRLFQGQLMAKIQGGFNTFMHLYNPVSTSSRIGAPPLIIPLYSTRGQEKPAVFICDPIMAPPSGEKEHGHRKEGTIFPKEGQSHSNQCWCGTGWRSPQGKRTFVILSQRKPVPVQVVYVDLCLLICWG